MPGRGFGLYLLYAEDGFRMVGLMWVQRFQRFSRDSAFLEDIFMVLIICSVPPQGLRSMLFSR
jgi:hypothetical protein